MKCWVSNYSSVHKMHGVRRYLSLHSPTAEFGQRNKRIHMPQLEGQEPKQICKSGPLTKLQSCKSQDLLQDLIYAVVQHSQKYSRFFSNADKGSDNS